MTALPLPIPRPAVRPPSVPMMTPAEVDFLAAHLKPTDHVFEWGSGSSTAWLAHRVRSVVAVEHSRVYALETIHAAPSNVTVIFAPPEPLGYEEDDDGGDGSLDGFRSYVQSYVGRNVDVVLIDGRARVWCAREVLETALFGPHPGMRVFMHDADRPEVSRVWSPEADTFPRYRLAERVDNLALLQVVFE